MTSPRSPKLPPPVKPQPKLGPVQKPGGKAAFKGTPQVSRKLDPGTGMRSQQETAKMQQAAQLQESAARRASTGMAKGGMVKANCGASMKPNGKSKK